MKRAFVAALLIAVVATLTLGADVGCEVTPITITAAGDYPVLQIRQDGKHYRICSVGGRVTTTVFLTVSTDPGRKHQQTTGRNVVLPLDGAVVPSLTINADKGSFHGWIMVELVPGPVVPPPPPPADADGDGVSDNLDACPATPVGTPVDAKGCPIVTPPPPPPADSDGDGVLDGSDACPGTPQGTPVGPTGCPIVTPPPSGSVHTAADVTYLGAYQMPPGTDTTFAYGGMAARVVNGVTTLFVYDKFAHVLEVRATAEPGLNYRTAPKLALVRNWGDVTHGKRQSWDPKGSPLVQPLIPSHLAWNEARQLLYWGYFDGYGVAGNQDWSMGASKLNADGTSEAYGPWRPRVTDRDGQSWYGPRRCNWIFTEPAGTMGCVGGQTSGNISNAWGPSIHGGIPWPTAVTPGGFGAPDLPATTHGAEYYTMIGSINPDGSPRGPVRSWSMPLPYRRAFETSEPLKQDVAPAFNGGRNTFSDMDGIGGCLWVNTPGKASVVCTANLVGVAGDPLSCATGAHRWYATAANGYRCDHGCTGVPNTGPIVNRENPNSMFPALLIMNPADLAAVNAGTKADYSVDPEMVDLQARFKIQTAPVDLVGGNKNIKTGYFDPATRRLYLISTQADNSQPGIWLSLIHVFEIR